MERKIGEIFECNGEWYQCVNGFECTKCDLHQNKRCTARYNDIGSCSKNSRKDNTPVIFKKLEKVGEPFTCVGKRYQYYKVFDIDNVYGDVFLCVHNYKAKTLTIEIKQTKEDMEEKNNGNTPLNVLTDKYVNGDICYDDFEKEVKALYSCKEEIKPTLKEFDLEAAKAGKPVCTRDGRKARIICFDRVGDFPIVALTDDRDYKEEGVNLYDINGKGSNECFDLMMLPEKKEGWVNVYKIGARLETGGNIHKTKEEAIKYLDSDKQHIATVKIEWEE